MKLYLDMATSLLIFLDSYSPSFQERREQLAKLATNTSHEATLGCDLRELANRISICTDRKLGISSSASETHSLHYKEAIRQAHDLWRSELSLLTGQVATATDAQLLDAWAKSRPYSEKVRGWLYVARAQGWLRSIEQWPRWVKMLWKGSPRYWIYSASCSLLFSLAGDDAGWTQQESLEFASKLPVMRSLAPAGVSWPRQEIGKVILWNYKKFLAGTRA